MTIDRSAGRYLVAGVVGLAAAVIAILLLQSSPSTGCVRDSVRIQIGPQLVDTTLGQLLPGCPHPPFDAVLAFVKEQAQRAKADASYVPESPDSVKGLAAILVWEALFAATAGIAATTAVLAGFKTADLRQLWGLPSRSIWISGLVAAAIIAAPFVVLRSLPQEQLSPFDLLHHERLTWMTIAVAALTVPAATGLLLIRHIVVSRTDVRLGDLADLGSHMRDLVSMLGAVLSLAVVVTASRWQMIAALPGGEGIPSTLILLWGAVFAAVLAAIYVPAYERWSAVTKRAIADEVRTQFPAHGGPGTVGYRPPELAAKKELQATLGLGGPLRNLQGSVAVLAPIFAAAISSLFSS